MKKLGLVFVFILSIASLFGDAKSVRTESFTVQAGFGEVMEVYITEIPAQGSSFLEGMPFNIEDDIVKFNAGGRGRTIAYIDIIANTNCRIYVKADNLKWSPGPTGETAANPPELGYKLNFDYQVSYINTSNEAVYSDRDIGFSIDSGGAEQYADLFSGGNRFPESEYKTFISVNNGMISFMFDSETTSKIHNDPTSVPVGLYKGDVTVRLEAM